MKRIKLNNMRRSILRFALLGIIAIAVVSCAKTQDKQSEPIWDKAAAVLYANLGQIYDKSDVANMDLATIEQALRQKSSAEDNAKIDLIMEILRNPNSSGIDIYKPAYIAIYEYYADQDIKHASLSMEVSDIKMLDSTLEGFKDKAQVADVELVDNKRIIAIDNYSYMGYDNDRLVVIHCEVDGIDPKQKLLEYLSYAPADMSRFGDRDIAIHLDIDRLASLNAPIESTTTETDVEGNGDTENDASDDTSTLSEEYWEAYNQYFTEESSLILGISFENGSIIIDSDCNGINNDIKSMFTEADGSNLKLLETSPLAILNVGLNGEVASEMLNIGIDALMTRNGANVSNEFNIIKNIALGVVSSIHGDLTLALSDAEGKLIEDIIHGEKLVFTTADALLAAKVKDDYIMQNVALYGSSFLQRAGSNRYTTQMYGNRIHIGERDSTFFIGVNNSGDDKSPSSASEEWSNNVLGSYIYAMIDFNQLFSTSFGHAALSNIYKKTTSSDERKLIEAFANNTDHLFILSNGGDNYIHGELMLTLRDGNNNALKQLITTLYNN